MPRDASTIAPSSDHPTDPPDEPHEPEQPIHALPTSEELRKFGLTNAELELLPLLVQHLSFADISGVLKLPRSTIDARALSIHRKLGVSPLSDMID
jgi:DNA-binding NarL/FixJ family response regulator